MALSIKQRLSKKKDIERVLQNGRKISNASFRLFFYPAKDGVFRGTTVISRKVSKKATVRNRLRRRISGLLQKDKKLLSYKLDSVFFVSPAAAERTKKQFYEDLRDIFDRLHKTVSKNSIS